MRVRALGDTGTVAWTGSALRGEFLPSAGPRLVAELWLALRSNSSLLLTQACCSVLPCGRVLPRASSGLRLGPGLLLAPACGCVLSHGCDLSFDRVAVFQTFWIEWRFFERLARQGGVISFDYPPLISGCSIYRHTFWEEPRPTFDLPPLILARAREMRVLPPLDSKCSFIRHLFWREPGPMRRCRFTATYLRKSLKADARCAEMRRKRRPWGLFGVQVFRRRSLANASRALVRGDS